MVVSYTRYWPDAVLVEAYALVTWGAVVTIVLVSVTVLARVAAAVACAVEIVLVTVVSPSMSK